MSYIFHLLPLGGGPAPEYLPQPAQFLLMMSFQFVKRYTVQNVFLFYHMHKDCQFNPTAILVFSLLISNYFYMVDISQKYRAD